MRYVVQWNTFVDAADMQKCRKVLARLESAIGRPLVALSAERYWKDRRLFKVSGQTQHDAIDPQSASMEIQGVQSKLAKSWVVSGPLVYDRFGLELDSVASQGTIRIPGIDFISSSVLPLAAIETDEKQGMLMGFS